MYSERRKCDKCGLMIIAQNRLIHEAQCNPIRNYESQISGSENNINEISFSNSLCGSSIKSAKKNNPEEEFWFCNTCQNYLDMQDKNDHILSHQFQDLDEDHDDDDSMMDTDEMNANEVRHRNMNNMVENPINSRNNIQRNGNNINRTSILANPFLNLNRNTNVEAETDSDTEETNITNNINQMNRQDPLFNHNPFLIRRGNNVPSFNGVDFSNQRTSNIPNNRNTTIVTRTINHPNGGNTTITTTTSNGNTHSIRTTNSNFISMFDQNNPLNYGRHGNNINNMSNHSFFMNHPSELENLFVQLAERMHAPRINPVNENLISSLPRITISDHSKIPAEKKDCVICLTKYELEEKAILLPCTHMFHTECVKSWFKNQDTCPICKLKINARTLNGLNDSAMNSSSQEDSY